jgi:hypothetical protein
MLYNRTIDRFLIVAVPAGLFVYASTRPIVRLRADMPAQFVDAPASASAKHRAEEERMARAYWNCAVALVQWKHSYGSPLPEIPPAEFRIDEKTAPASEAASLSRLRYWHQLQSLWLSPEVWTASREWNTQWLTETIAHVVEGIEDYFGDLLKMK